MMEGKIRHLGSAGHFCSANRCMWHRHTHIDERWCVSSVGEYFPEGAEAMEPIGAGAEALYEVMVFDMWAPESRWTEIDGTRSSNRSMANGAHDAAVARWAAVAVVSK